MLKWNDGYSVGIQEFDNQHKKLFELINKLHAAMKEGKGKDVAGHILEELANYTIYHFESEERAFEQAGYSLQAGHVAEHKKFVARVSESIEKFNAGNTLVTVDLILFLTDWIINHIEKSDQKYSEELIKAAVVY